MSGNSEISRECVKVQSLVTCQYLLAAHNTALRNTILVKKQVMVTLHIRVAGSKEFNVCGH